MKNIIGFDGNEIELITDKWADKSAMVVLSGGQDSAFSLMWARANFRKVGAITFKYGQRHEAEVISAVAIAQKCDKVRHQVINLGDAFPKGNAIAGRHLITNTDEILPSTFVPGRNLVFLSSAAGYAYEGGYQHLVAGMCQTDYSGYPDCRGLAIDPLQLAIAFGVYDCKGEFRIHTPLMYRSKADSVLMALGLGDDCMEVIALSHTCYQGIFPPCGECPACKIRAQGFKAVGIDDPMFSDLNPRWDEWQATRNESLSA